MKKTLFMFSFMFFGLMAASISANDPYCCVEDDACCPETGFNGFYVGGNIAVFSHVAHRNDLDGFLTDNSGWSTIDTGFAGGVQVGYDWECTSKVFGIVVDWNGVDINHRLKEEPNSQDDNFIKSNLDWYTTIRARAGIEVCNGLVYVTGGAAVSRFETKWQNLDVSDFAFKHHDTHWGWTGGFGTEFIFCRNISVGAEFLFLHFDDDVKKFSDEEVTPVFYSFGHSNSAWTGKILINYRFGNWCCR